MRGILIAIFGVFLLVAGMVFRRKQSYPEKSYFHCFLNVILTPLRLLRLGPFKHGENYTLTYAMQTAMQETKLKGDPTVAALVEDIDQITRNNPIHEKLRFTNLGYLIHMKQMEQSMARRLRLLDYLERHPVIKTIPVISPIFVISPPRCGTTFMHRLISLDEEQMRAPFLWELMAPTPENGLFLPFTSDNRERFLQTFTDDRHRRAERCRALFREQQKLGDRAMEHIHEFHPDLAEECIWSLAEELPLQFSYLYTLFQSPDRLFSVISQDRAEQGFRYYKQILQLLSYQLGEWEKPRHWVLKCPVHLFYLPAIAKVFPDVKVVWTHRHPVAAIPSLCSLLASGQQVFYEKEGSCDAASLGQSIKGIFAEKLLEASQAVEQLHLPCAHVLYEDLIADPVTAVKKVYAQLNLSFTSDYEQKIQKFLEEDAIKREEKKKERGKENRLHYYTPQEYALTREELSVGPFAEYCEKYQIPNRP